MIGKTLAHYEIRDLLGEGGMGRVYRALDTSLGREVAVKLLPAELSTDTDRLAQHLVSGPLTVERVVELGTAIADALSAAHDKGVVHRDLKPANVMLTREGRVKVLDFGLAKLEEDDTDGAADVMNAATLASPLSEAGQMTGTLPYMAPEQVRGEAVDKRTDIFALGILLYELATGRRPFEGKTPGVLSSAILRDAPSSVSSLRKDAPAALEHIISRCLEKDPDARYQTALDVGVELRRMVGGSSSISELRRDPGRIFVAPPTP